MNHTPLVLPLPFRFFLRYGNVVAPVPFWNWTSEVTGAVRDQGEVSELRLAAGLAQQGFEACKHCDNSACAVQVHTTTSLGAI